MPRSAPAYLAFAVTCLSAVVPANAGPTVPAYFFKEWSIRNDCSEQHAGPLGHVQKGLRFRIERSTRSTDGESYTLRPIDVDRRKWAPNWKRVTLQYRPGTKMRSVPADFECVPGQEASSPFLAMSSYSQTAEPWYEFEHWYGILFIHGEPHHVLIFPRDHKGASSAIIVLQDVDSSDTIKLDHNGTIHSDD